MGRAGDGFRRIRLSGCRGLSCEPRRNCVAANSTATPSQQQGADLQVIIQESTVRLAMGETDDKVVASTDISDDPRPEVVEAEDGNGRVATGEAEPFNVLDEVINLS